MSKVDIDGGRTLKAIRIFLDMSQDEFAHLLGSTKTTISRRENGTEAKLSLSEVVKLQDALASRGKEIRDFIEASGPNTQSA